MSQWASAPLPTPMVQLEGIFDTAAVNCYKEGCSAKTRGVGIAFPHQLKRKTAPQFK